MCNCRSSSGPTPRRVPAAGYGTYSMKLLSERYLGGSVSFESSEDTGTVFRARYPVAPVA